MSPGPMWRRYLRFFGADPRADLDDELRFHLEQRQERLRRQGLSEPDALAEALRRFGDVDAVRAECASIDRRVTRATHRLERLDRVRQDLRFALRQVARAPVVTLAVMLVLGLGIGAGATIFALVDAILLRPLPAVHQPARLASISSTSLSYPMWRDFRGDVAGRLDLAGFSGRSFAVSAGDRTAIVQGLAVTGNYFRVLGTTPSQGRLLTDADDAVAAPPVAVVSHRFWRDRLGGDSLAAGRAIQVNGFTVTVVGVAPPRFRGSQLAMAPDLWMTANGWLPIAGPQFAGRSLERRGWTWLQAIGRLAPSERLEGVEAVLAQSAARQAATWPNDVPPTEIRLAPAAVASTGRDGRGMILGFIGVLAGTVGLVLLLACANVANLLLARAEERRRELAVRTALGAGRSRLAGQLLTESLVLGLGGGTLGLLMAPVALAGLRQWTFPGGISLEAMGLGLDVRLVLVVLLLGLLTSILFGLAPAIRAGHQDPAAALHGARSGTGRERRRLQAALLAGQVAISLTLLIGAGLFGNSLRRGLGADLGFDAEGVVGAQVNLALNRYTRERAAAYYEQALERVRALPGVAHAGWVLAPPLTSDADAESFRIVGDPPPERGQRLPVIEINVVSPDYFRVLGITPARGRGFDERDTPAVPRVVVVNQTFVRRHLAGRDPIGVRIAAVGDTAEIVGVVPDMAYHSVREEPRPYAWFASSQVLHLVALSPMTLLVKTAGAPEGLLPSLGAALTSVDPGVPVTGPVTLLSLLDEVLLPERLGILLVGLMSGLAAIVAAVGIGAAVAYAVGRHRRDMAVRLALGASPHAALGSLLRPTVVHLGAGIGLGLAGGVALGRVLAGVVYGLDPIEPATLVGVTAGLAGLAALATLLPARKALRIDPMAELRQE